MEEWRNVLMGSGIDGRVKEALMGSGGMGEWQDA